MLNSLIMIQVIDDEEGKGWYMLERKHSHRVRAHELRSLLRFSRRLSRSTRLWCIFSAIFS